VEEVSAAIKGVVGVFQDVTELKKLERMRIDFVANVSHELRTPLTSVKGYAQTLLEDLKAKRYDQGEKYIEVVNRNVDRLLVLVGDLLDLSSIESGLQLQIRRLNARTILKPVMDQVAPLQNSKEIKIDIDSKAEELDGDETRVQQVLLNLIQNAIQYIPEKHTIKIVWSNVEKGVELRVCDDGPGIAPEHLSRLFERFYRVDMARNRESGGTGLGLAIVKHIMQRHGGTVRVESQVGKGTEFICYFPKHDNIVHV
jgi:two-component system phosphate regulon sensor histidine kinase PhoR